MQVANDPREKVTTKEFKQLKHAASKERDFLLHQLNLVSFYRCELTHLRINKAISLGTEPDGTPRDAAFFERKIKEAQEQASVYQASVNTMLTKVRQLDPFIRAKGWF